MQTGIHDWGDVVLASLPEALGRFASAIPKIIGFVIIFIIVRFIAGLVEKGIAVLLRVVKSDDLATRSGLANFVSKMGIKTDSAVIIALILLVAAFNALGLPVVSDVLSQLSPELPNFVVVLVVLVIGGIAAGALSNLVRGSASNAELGNPDLLAKMTNVAVGAFTIIIAINQVGIADTLITTLFIAAVSAVVALFGLAFRLSGRETAEIVRGWYKKGKQAIPKMKEAAQDIKEQTQQQNRQSVQPPG